MTSEDARWIVGFVISGLAVTAWFMIRGWKKSWEDRIIAQDRRLDGHGEQISETKTELEVLKSDVGHIRETVDETRTDVKTLVRQANGTSRNPI